MVHASVLNNPHQAQCAIHIWQDWKSDCISEALNPWGIFFYDYRGLTQDILTEKFYQNEKFSGEIFKEERSVEMTDLILGWAQVLTYGKRILISKQLI